ncbi:MAG TPA: protease pro-enzyme activation domain-containing protein [Steroidobacteraceae bacterium]
MTNIQRLPLIPACALALLACAPCAWTQTPTAAVLQSLQHHVRPAITSGAALEVGRVPLDQQFQISLQLEPRNQAELQDLLGELSNPASPRYRQWLTPEQFAEQFGRTEAEVSAVVAWATTNGLEID